MAEHRPAAPAVPASAITAPSAAAARHDLPEINAVPVHRWPPWLPYASGVVLIAALVASLAAISFWQEKQRYRERATVATQNIARLLELNVNDVFAKADIALQSAAFHYRDEMEGGRLDPAKLTAALVQQESLLPELSGLRIVDPEGFIKFGSNIPTKPPVNVADRDYFLRARDDPTAGLIVSGPLVGRINKRWVIVLARRLNKLDGSFAGIIYGALPTAHFQNALASVAVGAHGAATIRTTDLALVHRVPSVLDAVGSTHTSQQLRDIMQAHSAEGSYIAATALDGIERSNAYRRLERYPFYVIVGLATDDYLGGWKSNVLMIGSLAGLAILLTALAAALVYRSARRLALDIEQRMRAEAEVRRLNQGLERRVSERTAQWEAANQDLEAFCYSVSHDLRAPLRHIDAYAELLVTRCRDGLGDKCQHYVDAIASSARQMGVLIDELLKFSRSGMADISLEGLNMNQVLQDALMPLKDSHAERTIEWVIGELPSVRGDYALLRQVWANLLGNAIKFTRPRELARIEVSAHAGKGEIIFVVADNGVGFDMQYAGKLFGVFQRLHAEGEYDGVGVGLAIVQRIVVRHGGRVWAEAELNHGATFYFTLPSLAENNHV